MAWRLGEAPLAERHFRDALALGVSDNFLLFSYADFLLERGRPKEVVALLKDWTRSDTLLLRLAMAETALGLPDAQKHVRVLGERFAAAALRVTGVLGPDQPRLALRAEGRSRWAQFLDYGREGVWHIGIGIDHVLFLLSLLLPAVLAAPRFAPAFWDVFKVATAFTVAHSITLSLAALSVIALPSRLVESAIALSVVLAALNNLWPVVHRGRWLVAFGFGLVHGFGFASVLTDLGLPKDALLVALVGFKLGVEAGQLLIVSAFLPLAYALRRTWLYRRMIFVGGSAAIAFIAALWMLERMFDLDLGLI